MDGLKSFKEETARETGTLSISLGHASRRHCDYTYIADATLLVRLPLAGDGALGDRHSTGGKSLATGANRQESAIQVAKRLDHGVFPCSTI